MCNNVAMGSRNKQPIPIRELTDFADDLQRIERHLRSVIKEMRECGMEAVSGEMGTARTVAFARISKTVASIHAEVLINKAMSMGKKAADQ